MGRTTRKAAVSEPAAARRVPIGSGPWLTAGLDGDGYVEWVEWLRGVYGDLGDVGAVLESQGEAGSKALAAWIERQMDRVPDVEPGAVDELRVWFVHAGSSEKRGLHTRIKWDRVGRERVTVDEARAVALALARALDRLLDELEDDLERAAALRAPAKKEATP